MLTFLPSFALHPAQLTIARARSLCVAVAALRLLVPAGQVSAQDVIDPETAKNAMVLIRGTRGGESVQGSGFIVALDRERSIATILTSSHVIEGATFEVRFHADSLAPAIKDAEVKSIQHEAKDGLAVLIVRNAPKRAIALELAGRDAPHPRVGLDSLYLIGYANMRTTPAVVRRDVMERDNGLYTVDQRVGEGSSGGPALLNGKVVGLVSNTTDAATSVVPFAAIRLFLGDDVVDRVESLSAPAPAAAPPAPSSGLTGPDPVAPESPTAVALSEFAMFFFPVGPPKLWRWWRPESKDGEDEYRWLSTIATDLGRFTIFGAVGKSAGVRVKEGNFKALVGDAVIGVFKDGASYRGDDLKVSADVDDAFFTLSLEGSSVPKLLGPDARRPKEATFEILMPGVPIQSWTVPMIYRFDFTLLNHTEVEIESLWMAPGGQQWSEETGVRRWIPTEGNEEDLLGEDRFGQGTRRTFTVRRPSAACEWVIVGRPTDKRKPDLAYEKLNLCRLKDITLNP